MAQRNFVILAMMIQAHVQLGDTFLRIENKHRYDTVDELQLIELFWQFAYLLFFLGNKR